MEKIKAPECCSFHRRYNKAPAIHLGVHAERDFNEVRRGKSERGSD